MIQRACDISGGSGRNAWHTAGFSAARVYHTGVGRWLTEDPLLGNLGDPMSFNRYLYTNANPVDYSDPSGLRTTRNRCAITGWENVAFQVAKGVGTGLGAVGGAAVGGGFSAGIGTAIGGAIGGAAGRVETAALWYDLTGRHGCYKAEEINTDLYVGALARVGGKLVKWFEGLW